MCKLNRRRAPAQLWRNTSTGGNNWLQLRLVQDGPNVDAIGASIEVTVGGETARRELTVGGGHAGGQLGWAHFGLGPANRARVTVRWPDGTDQAMTLPANAFATIMRGSPVQFFDSVQRR